MVILSCFMPQAGALASLVEKFEPLEGLGIEAYAFLNATSEKIEGKTLKGRPTLIHFWATFCKPCIEELAVIKETLLDRKDLAFYAICINKKDTNEIVSFNQENGLKEIPIYKDSERLLLKVFENKGVPATYFVNHEGIVMGRTYGVIDWKTEENQNFLKNFSAGTLMLDTQPQPDTVQKMKRWFKNLINF